MADAKEHLRVFFGLTFGLMAVAYYSGYGFDPRTARIAPQDNRVVVVGGALFDILCTPSDTHSPILMHTSNPGHVQQSWGGVGRNVAEAAAVASKSVLSLSTKEPAPVLLVSLVGEDSFSETFFSHHRSLLDVSGVSKQEGKNTATYVAVESHSEDKSVDPLIVAIAETDIIDSIDPNLIKKWRKNIKGAKVVVVDGNLRVDTISQVLEFAQTSEHTTSWFESTSCAKSTKIVSLLDKVDIVSGNYLELITIFAEIKHIPSNERHDLEALFESHLSKGKDLTSQELFDLVRPLVKVLFERGLGTSITTFGGHGIVIAMNATPIKFQRIEAIPVEKVVQVTGAGDSLVGCAVALMAHGLSLSESLSNAVYCSSLKIQNRFSHSTRVPFPALLP